MRIGIMRKRIGSLTASVLLALCLLGFSAGEVWAAPLGPVTIPVPMDQTYTNTGLDAAPGNTFSYVLTARSPGYPMPTGSVAGVYTFSMSGNASRTLDFSFTAAGIYYYDIAHTTSAVPGYIYDNETYTIEIYVKSDLTTSVSVYKPNLTGMKTGSVEYKHSSNFQSASINKIISGSPSSPSSFSFRLTRVSPSSAPVPAGSVSGVRTLGRSGAGLLNLGTWSYTAAGTYTYRVTEVNTGASGYTYDTEVYTITDTVTPDVNGLLQVVRGITDHTGGPVTSMAFTNSYSYTPPPVDPPRPPRPPRPPIIPTSVVPPDPDPDPPIVPPPTPEPTPTNISPSEPPVTISGKPVPLDDNEKPAWALLNLILCIAGAILGVIMIVRAILRKKERERDEKEQYGYENDENGKQKQVYKKWLVVTAILAIAGVIFFILTEDMRNPMVIIDRWTIVNLLIFVAEIVFYYLTFRKKDESEEEEENTMKA